MTHGLISFCWFCGFGKKKRTKNDDGLGVVILVVVVVAWVFLVWARSAVESRNGLYFGRLDTNAQHPGGCAPTIRKSNSLSIVGDRRLPMLELAIKLT